MAKALSMSILFNQKHYKKIVQILNKKDDPNYKSFEEDLRIELERAELDPDEIKWATNYLKCYDKVLAAASDKKWTHEEAQEFHW